MKSIAILGATGNLGRHIASQALERSWTLSVGVRNRARLAPHVASKAHVTDLDLASATSEELASFASGQDVFVFCAGMVTEGNVFVRMVDDVVTALDALPLQQRPVCWFLAGAALLPLDATGRMGVELPKVRDTYWPHRKNWERLQRSGLDWRLLCPGPMVEQKAVGAQHLRVSIDSHPSALSPVARWLPGPLVLPLFAMKIPEMIIPYADAAAVILENVEAPSPMSRRRVGVALPAGMKGKKDTWTARPRDAAVGEGVRDASRAR